MCVYQPNSKVLATILVRCPKLRKIRSLPVWNFFFFLFFNFISLLSLIFIKIFFLLFPQQIFLFAIFRQESSVGGWSGVMDALYSYFLEYWDDFFFVFGVVGYMQRHNKFILYFSFYFN